MTHLGYNPQSINSFSSNWYNERSTAVGMFYTDDTKPETVRAVLGFPVHSFIHFFAILSTADYAFFFINM